MPGLTDIIGLGVLLRWQDKATAGMKKAADSLKALSGSIGDTDDKAAALEARYKSLGKVGAVITGFGLAGAASLYGLARAASTYEDALIDTMTMTGLTGKAFESMEGELSSLAIAMSTRFGMSATDISKSFYQVISSGAKAGTRQFEALSESALTLAKVVGMEPAVAVESLSDVLHSFEMDATQAGRMADVFFETSMLGATTVSQTAEAMREASKVAVEMKLPLEDVAAVLVGFANKGVKGTEAGTAFRMMMTRLAAPMARTQEALEDLGVSVYDADTRQMRPMIEVLKDLQGALADVTHEEREAAIKAIAGEEAFAKVGSLLSTDLSAVEAWSKELKTGGVLQTAFAQKTATMSFAFAYMRESLRNIAITLGQHLLPVFAYMARAIGFVANKVQAFVAAHPLLTKLGLGFAGVATAVALVVGPILAFVGLVGALGGVSVIVGSITAGFASLATVAATLGGVIAGVLWPVTAVVAGIAGLYLAFRTNFLGIGDIAKAVGNTIGRFFTGAWEGVKAALGPAITLIGEAWSQLKQAAAPIWEAVSALGELIGFAALATSEFGPLKTAVTTVGKVLGYILVLPLKLAFTEIGWLIKGFAGFIRISMTLGWWLGSAFKAGIMGIVTAFGYVKDVVGLVSIGFGVLKSFAGEVLDEWMKVGDALYGIFTAIGDTVSKVFTTIRDTIMSVVGAVWDKIEWVISKIPDVFLPESLENIKYARLASEAATGRAVAPASIPEPVMARPVFPATLMPAFAMGAAVGAGSVDRSVNIAQGAVVINATKIDERAAMQIDRELARLIERRMERQ